MPGGAAPGGCSPGARAPGTRKNLPSMVQQVGFRFHIVIIIGYYFWLAFWWVTLVAIPGGTLAASYSSDILKYVLNAVHAWVIKEGHWLDGSSSNRRCSRITGTTSKLIKQTNFRPATHRQFSSLAKPRDWSGREILFWKLPGNNSAHSQVCEILREPSQAKEGILGFYLPASFYFPSLKWKGYVNQTPRVEVMTKHVFQLEAWNLQTLKRTSDALS